MFSKVKANQGLELEVCSVKLREALRPSWSCLLLKEKVLLPVIECAKVDFKNIPGLLSSDIKVAFI